MNLWAFIARSSGSSHLHKPRFFFQRQASHRAHDQVCDGDACHIRGNADKWSAVQAQGWQADEILEGLGRGLTGRAIHIVLWTVRD